MAKNIFKVHQEFADKMAVVFVGELHTTDSARKNLRSIQTILKEDLGCHPNVIIVEVINDSFDVEKCLGLQLKSSDDEKK